MHSRHRSFRLNSVVLSLSLSEKGQCCLNSIGSLEILSHTYEALKCVQVIVLLLLWLTKYTFPTDVRRTSHTVGSDPQTVVLGLEFRSIQVVVLVQ